MTLSLVCWEFPIAWRSQDCWLFLVPPDKSNCGSKRRSPCSECRPLPPVLPTSHTRPLPCPDHLLDHVIYCVPNLLRTSLSAFPFLREIAIHPFPVFDLC